MSRMEAWKHGSMENYWDNPEPRAVAVDLNRSKSIGCAIHNPFAAQQDVLQYISLFI